MDEVLLYTENVDEATAEIEAAGGRVMIQLGEDLLIASLPTNIATKQDAFAYASTQLSSTASASARTSKKIYEMYREKKLAPQPKIQLWTEKTAPKSFPRTEPVPENSPYTQTLRGKIATVLIVPSGPGSLAMSDDEYEKAVSEAIAGLQFWVNKAPSSAKLSFVLYYGRATISTSNPTSCSSKPICHDAYVFPALSFFKYSSKDSLAQDAKNHAGADGAFLAFISKYRQGHFAYAYFSGGPIYMQYSNDGWGVDKLDRVFAHEVGHVFNAPNEYGTSCDCYKYYGKGSCTSRNWNCGSCTSSQRSCIMNTNDFEICPYTEKHLGWC